MAKRKKLRSDAAENRLPEAGQIELQSLVARNAPLDDIIALFARHGQPVALSTASRAHARLQAAGENLLKRNQALAVIRQHAAQAGVTLTQAALEQGAIAVGDILDGAVDPNSDEGQKLLLAGLGVLTGVRNSEIQDKRVTQQRDQLRLARDRFEFDAAKAALAQLPALRKIAADKSLDDTARLDAVRRQLFGEVAA